MATDATAPKPTIVLIHGLWMSPLAWEDWISYYETKGYNVIAPGWPGIDDRTPEQIRKDPKPLTSITIEKIVDHYTDIVKALPEKPIIMGHSFGGLFTQILVDRGLASVGVGISPAQPAGIFNLPLSTVRATTGILANPFTYRAAVPISLSQFHFAFGNHNARQEQSKPAYERYSVPAAAHVLWQAALAGTNKSPKAAGHVDFARADRVPLLLIAGTKDHVVAQSTVLKEFEAYQKGHKTDDVEMKVFEGRSHGIVNQDGWQEVADYALAFVEKHLKKPTTTA